MNKKIIVISALWCPSCLILKKHIKKLKNDYKDLIIKTLDYDFDEIEEYKVGNILPVIISYIDDKEKNRLIGEKTYEEIISFLKDSEII